MKQLTDYKEIIGKKITDVCEVDIGKKVVLLLGDNAYFVMESAESYGDAEIQTFNELSAYEKSGAGIITEAELEEIENIKRQKRTDMQTSKELTMLAELKAKYE